jgi:hypothetical protein
MRYALLGAADEYTVLWQPHAQLSLTSDAAEPYQTMWRLQTQETTAEIEVTLKETGLTLRWGSCSIQVANRSRAGRIQLLSADHIFQEIDLESGALSEPIAQAERRAPDCSEGRRSLLLLTGLRQRQSTEDSARERP